MVKAVNKLYYSSVIVTWYVRIHVFMEKVIEKGWEKGEFLHPI